MTDLLYALGVGFSFSIGVFAGAYLCRSSMSAKDNSDKSDWADHCSEVEARLSVYAENTTRMANALDKIASIENNQLETPDEKTGTSCKIQFIETEKELPLCNYPVLIRINDKETIEPIVYRLRCLISGTSFHPVISGSKNDMIFCPERVAEWAYLPK